MILKTKRGFGSVASTLIMFIAILGVTTGLVISFKTYLSETQSSFAFQNEITTNKLKTSISISHVSYNTTSETLYVYVKNVGETKMRPQKFDLYIDDAFTSDYIARSPSNLSANVTILDLQDTVAIEKGITLEEGSHEVRIVSEYGVGTKESFNI